MTETNEKRKELRAIKLIDVFPLHIEVYRMRYDDLFLFSKNLSTPDCSINIDTEHMKN